MSVDTAPLMSDPDARDPDARNPARRVLRQIRATICPKRARKENILSVLPCLRGESSLEHKPLGVLESISQAGFRNCELDSRRITLAPPIARRVVAVSWTPALRWENLRLFNSHYLVGIRTRQSAVA